MGLFEQFPYSNFHGLNLDWILKTIKDLETQISEFVSINSIKYADPIIWNITTQYEKNTVVLDVTGDGYISVKPVPSGISIDRTEYWTKIGNFSALWGGVKKSITPEDEGHSSTATKPRNVGDLVWLNDILVEITTAISVGSAYIVGSNCRVYSMQILLTEIQNEIIAEQTARANADTTLQNSIINETTLRTNADTTLQTNITTETTERKAAITEESQARETSDNNLQTRINNFKKFNVLDYGAKGDGISDDTAAIQAATNAASVRGGEVKIPLGVYKITSTIVCNSSYVVFSGDGGATDGNQPYNDTWPNIVSKAATRIVWAGASGGTMLNIQPIDDGAHTALNGNGVSGIMWDGAEIAGIGWLLKTLRTGRYSDSSVVRCKTANISLGTTTQMVFGDNVSFACNVFDNICACNALLTTTCNASIPWIMWGNDLHGGVCENEFVNCQSFSATYAHGTPSWSIEDSDDNSFIECKWNSSMILQAEDTGTHNVTSFALSQNHFFYKTMGHIIVKEALDPTTKRPSYGHAVYGYSGNNFINPPTVEGRGDISVHGTTINYSQELGTMSYGLQPAITNLYLTSQQATTHGGVDKITWSATNIDQLIGWSSSTPTDITVPNNIKFAEILAYVEWDSNSTGQRYLGIYYNNSPVAEMQIPAEQMSQMTVFSGVIPVQPGKKIDIRTMQASGGALNLSSVCRCTVKWC